MDKNFLDKSLFFLQPLLMALYPASYLFVYNYAKSFVIDYILLVLFIIIFISILFFISNLKFKSFAKTSIFLSFFISIFYLLPVFRDCLSSEFIIFLRTLNLGEIRFIRISYIFVLLIPVLIVVFLKLLNFIKKTEILNFLAKFLFLPFLFLNIYALGQAFFSKYKASRRIDDYKKNNSKYVNNIVGRFIDIKDKKDLPDIYFIILDAYACNKTWLNYYGFDNSDFIRKLRDRGFFVNNNAYSNYASTHYSLASTLNFNLIDNRDDSLLVYKILNNKVVNLLESAGYKYYHVKSSSHFNSRIPFNRGSYLSVLFDRFFLPYGFIAGFMRIKTVIANFWDFLVKKKLFYDIKDQFDSLKKIVLSKKRKFIFAHILSPHPPIVFNENGLFCVGQDYGSKTVGQVKYLNKKTLEVVDFLINESKKPPIIIIQGDHGFYWSKKKEEKFGILSAFYLPGIDKKDLLENISPVNNFRFIFNKYFGTNFEILENKQIG